LETVQLFVQDKRDNETCPVVGKR